MEIFTFATMYNAFLAGVLGWTFAYTLVMRHRLNALESRLGDGE
jgi:hypothetical protein